ncbi:MAG: GNAT family N-acetyltransferase [Chloroflexi bacterium]|nr:GNAT family N-acetyltransferase [Chloroflexota bacterium]
MAAAERLRRPVLSDAPALGALAAKLGYPTSAEELLDRLAALHPTDAAVLVSTDANDQPTGWCHVEMRRTLVEPMSAMVLGLVIGEGHQSAGIGAELLAAAERWARARVCRQLVLATRITRKRAHRFYAREGYEVWKTSYFLTKALD